MRPPPPPSSGLFSRIKKNSENRDGEMIERTEGNDLPEFELDQTVESSGITVARSENPRSGSLAPRRRRRRRWIN